MMTPSKTLILCASALLAICAACSGADFTQAPAGDPPPDSDSGAVDSMAASGDTGGANMDTGTGGDVGSGGDASPGPDGGADTGSVGSDSGSGGSDASDSGGDSDSGSSDSGSGGADASDAGGDAGDAGDSGAVCTMCGGFCVDLMTDTANCGACGYATANGRTCVGGKPHPAWQSISTVGAPPARTRHAAAFLSPSFIVTGGAATQFGLGTTTVGYYNPTTDTWSTGTLGTARCSHGQVASSIRSYVWGGLSDCSSGSTVGPALEVYNPGTGLWSALSPSSPPALRYNYASVWVASQQRMFIYGGSDGSPSLSSGAFFSPMASVWTDASCSLAGCARSGFLGAFVDVPDNYIRVWGGNGSPGGLQYNMGTGAWSTWTLPAGTPSPMPQRYADDGRRIFYLQSAGVCPDTVTVLAYDRNTNSWAAADTSATPAGLAAEAATAWTGSELIAWSGSCGSSAPVAVGGRYQPPAP